MTLTAWEELAPDAYNWFLWVNILLIRLIHKKMSTNPILYIILSRTNYRDDKGKPSVFLLPDSKDLCDPTHEKFVHRDATKFLKVAISMTSIAMLLPQNTNQIYHYHYIRSLHSKTLQRSRGYTMVESSALTLWRLRAQTKAQLPYRSLCKHCLIRSSGLPTHRAK